MDKATIINDIRERLKKRISKGRKSENSFMDSVQYFKKNKALRFQDINERFIEGIKHFAKLIWDKRHVPLPINLFSSGHFST